MDDEVLIVLVQQYRELYDTFDPGYMNNIRRMNCWEEIAAQMINCTAEDCKKRWTQLRENYRKAKVRVDKTTTGQAAGKKKFVKFDKELSFLSDCLNEQRKQIGNVHDQGVREDPISSFTEESSSPTFCLNSPDTVAPSPAISSPASSSTVSPSIISPGSRHFASESFSPASRSPASAASVSTVSRTPTRYGRKIQKSPIAEYFKYKKDFQEIKLRSKVHQHTKNDHLSKFFQAMEESVRGFPPYLQVEAKSRISAIVLQLEAQAIQYTHEGQFPRNHNSNQTAPNHYGPPPPNHYGQIPQDPHGEQIPSYNHGLTGDQYNEEGDNFHDMDVYSPNTAHTAQREDNNKNLQQL